MNRKTVFAFVGLSALLLMIALLIIPRHASATLPVGSPLAGVVSCGTSTSCTSPTYVAGGQVVVGTVTLSSGVGAVTGLPNFTSSTSFGCVATDTVGTHIGTLIAANQSASAVTITSSITSSNSDTVFYVCVGN